MFCKRKLIFIGMLWLMLVLHMANAAYAQGGGEPGRDIKPLALSAVTLMDGGNGQEAGDIPTEPKFKVQFDKNVVNSLIWENNSNCFSLVSADGESLPLQVSKIDDTLDFTQRQNIFVQPAQPLKPGTVYYLKVSPALKTKNGVTLGEELSIPFKTAGEAPVALLRPTDPAGQEQNAASAGAPASEKENQFAPAEQEIAGADGANTGPAPADTQNQGQQPLKKTTSLSSWLMPIFVVCLAGWIAFEIWLRRSKQLRQKTPRGGNFH